MYTTQGELKCSNNNVIENFVAVNTNTNLWNNNTGICNTTCNKHPYCSYNNYNYRQIGKLYCDCNKCTRTITLNNTWAGPTESNRLCNNNNPDTNKYILNGNSFPNRDNYITCNFIGK